MSESIERKRAIRCTARCRREGCGHELAVHVTGPEIRCTACDGIGRHCEFFVPPPYRPRGAEVRSHLAFTNIEGATIALPSATGGTSQFAAAMLGLFGPSKDVRPDVGSPIGMAPAIGAGQAGSTPAPATSELERVPTAERGPSGASSEEATATRPGTTTPDLYGSRSSTGERLVCTQEVPGSSPGRSIELNDAPEPPPSPVVAALVAEPPFTVDNRVQTPAMLLAAWDSVVAGQEGRALQASTYGINHAGPPDAGTVSGARDEARVPAAPLPFPPSPPAVTASLPVAVGGSLTAAAPRPLFTSSRARCYHRCPREHLYVYEQGYRPVEVSEAIRFGSLIHTALEAWWQAVGEEERLAAARAAIVAAVATGKADAFEAAKADALMLGYHVRWVGEPLEVLAVEQCFEAPLVNPETGAPSKTWTLAGKIDAIVKNHRDGRVLVVEHKTSSEDVSSGSDYWKRLRLDGQIGTYFVGARALGHEVGGCIYDVIGKPALRPFKATPSESRKFTKMGALYAGQRERDETPEEYGERVVAVIAEAPDKFFSRGEVVRLETELSEWAWDAWQLAVQIREARRAGRWPRNPDACVRYGRTCEYFGVCTGEVSLDDPSAFRCLDNVHEELA